MFLLVTDVIWEFAETFHKNHRALTARAFDIIYFHEFLNPWHYLFQHFDVLIYWSQEPSMKLRGGGQKCHDWNAHLIFFHHDWWKFDGIKLFQSSR